MTYGADMRHIASLAEQRVFVQNLDTALACNVSQKTGDEKDAWDFDGTVTLEEVASSGFHAM